MVLLDEELKTFNISLLDKKFKDYKEVTGDPWVELAKKRDEKFKIDKENELKSLD